MKKKLKLSSIEVSSFITEFADNSHATVKGGTGIPETIVCLTGIYPTLPVLECAQTQTNGLNCPCDVITRDIITAIG